MHKNQIFGGIFFFVFFAIYFYMSFYIEIYDQTHEDVVKANTLPSIIGGVGLFLSLLFILLEWIKLRKNKSLNIIKNDSDDVREKGEVLMAENSLKKDYKSTYYILFFMFLFGWIIDYIGFVVSSILFLFSTLSVLNKNYKKNLIISISFSVVLWFILSVLFGMYLDKGMILNNLFEG